MFLENINSWDLKLESQLCVTLVCQDMEWFSFMGPLRKAVVAEDLHYDSAQNIGS